MAHPANDARAALGAMPADLEQFVRLTRRENRWPTYSTAEDEAARDEAVRALSALTLAGDGNGEPLPDGTGWRVEWTSRWWFLIGHAYPHPEVDRALDPASPVILIHRSPNRLLHGTEVVRMALAAVRDGLLFEAIRDARSRAV